ncbi:MAG: DegV family protein [Bacilli bacterium]|nr:DegV family protein [Bacilli bacterium]
MRIAISAESTIDLPKSLLNEWDIHTVPFTIIMGEETFFDGEIEPNKLFEYADRTGSLAKTSAVNTFQFEGHFKSLLEEYDAIVHISLSSKISSAYQNAAAASQKFANVYVIDSLSLSTGIALLAIYARKLASAGYEAKEVYAKTLERVPFDQASFSLESVNYLYKGGRCSALAMLGANLLRIKPEIYVKDGGMIAGKKYRGSMKKVVLSYVNDALEAFKNPDLEQVFITYSTAPDEVVEAVEARLKEVGFKRIDKTHAGGTVSAYCGPHCLGILFINDGEHPIKEKK